MDKNIKTLLEISKNYDNKDLKLNFNLRKYNNLNKVNKTFKIKKIKVNNFITIKNNTELQLNFLKKKKNNNIRANKIKTSSEKPTNLTQNKINKPKKKVYFNEILNNYLETYNKTIEVYNKNLVKYNKLEVKNKTRKLKAKHNYYSDTLTFNKKKYYNINNINYF